MLNKVQIIGNVTREPEINNGVARFSVAVNEKYKGKDGNMVETTEFFNCVAFSKLSDVIQNYVTKGMKVYCEGKQSTYKKDDKVYVNMNVSSLQMLGGGSKAEKTTTKVSEEPDFDDEIIPF